MPRSRRTYRHENLRASNDHAGDASDRSGRSLCRGLAPHIAREAEQSIQTTQDNAAIAAANVRAQAKIKDAQAIANPIAHPIVATAQAIKKIRTPLIIINVIAFVLLGVSIGLMWTPLSLVSKTAVPVCGAVAVLSLAGVIALPFFPWIVLAAAVGAVGIIVYEIVPL